MSLGATKAWTIRTKRVGVWFFRPTLVCFTVAFGTTLWPLAMFKLFLTFYVLVVSVELGVLPRKCKGTREYDRKLPLLPLARRRRGFANAALHKV